MNTKITTGIKDQLGNFCDQSDDIRESFGINNWSIQVSSFLETALGPNFADEFNSLKTDDEWQQLSMRLGHIQGLIAKATADVQVDKPVSDSELVSDWEKNKTQNDMSRKVFVVHGRDNEAKETMARFLEKLNLHPIILHEQPNSGRTIIEKFETYSKDISFAIVLLTPDDIGGINNSNQKQLPRARAKKCLCFI
jgi:predicted nucleotide-binding protein